MAAFEVTTPQIMVGQVWTHKKTRSEFRVCNIYDDRHTGIWIQLADLSDFRFSIPVCNFRAWYKLNPGPDFMDWYTRER